MSEKKDKKIKPVDNTTVYATALLKGIFEEGAEMTVHTSQAEKLIASGKATKDAPKQKGVKGDA